jgi:hypothetical protein
VQGVKHLYVCARASANAPYPNSEQAFENGAACMQETLITRPYIRGKSHNFFRCQSSLSFSSGGQVLELGPLGDENMLSSCARCLLAMLAAILADLEGFCRYSASLWFRISSRPSACSCSCSWSDLSSSPSSCVEAGSSSKYDSPFRPSVSDGGSGLRLTKRGLFVPPRWRSSSVDSSCAWHIFVRSA